MDCKTRKKHADGPLKKFKKGEREEVEKKTKNCGKKNCRNANEWTERDTNAPATEKFRSTARIHFASTRVCDKLRKRAPECPNRCAACALSFQHIKIKWRSMNMYAAATATAADVPCTVVIREIFRTLSTFRNSRYFM